MQNRGGVQHCAPPPEGAQREWFAYLYQNTGCWGSLKAHIPQDGLISFYFLAVLYAQQK